MTIATTTNRISYTGNGVTTLFSVPFTYYNASDLKVYVDGVLKTITTDYTVGSGGVTFVTAPASSKVVLIVREVPMTQTTDYKNFEPVDADELETNIDKLTILVQQADEKAARGINLDVTDSASSLTLPVTRANKVLAFDASGLPVASTKTLAQLESEADDAAASAVAAAASASAASASASAAATSESNAATSESNAATSETNAASSAASAATIYDTFDDRYLGAKATEPTVDNDGNALITGAMYFNTVDGYTYIYDGADWVNVFVTPATPPIDLATQVTGRLPNANLAQMATQTFKGRTTAGTGNAEDLTATQATAMLNVFDSSNKGLAPASGGGTTNFLRADGTWAAAGARFISFNSTSSGTSIDITGIPSNVVVIHLIFQFVSTNGTSGLIVQLGDSGGFETSGYSSVCETTAFSSGFNITPTTIAATNTRHGRVTLSLVNGTNWVFDSTLVDSTGVTTANAAGFKALSDVLTQIRLTTQGGANTFDGGSITVLYG